MSEIESLAEKVNTAPPWWSTAPIYLAASIVGVPSFLAVAAGFYIAQHVSTALRELVQLNQMQISLANEHITFSKRNYEILIKFIDDDLKCQYVTCINSSRSPEQARACISPKQREQEYGIVPP